MSREVVTLQLGHFANFVGTHIWNIQESSFCYDLSTISAPKEVDNDVLYREGSTLRGDVTYTPRLIAIDLKGSLNTLRPDGVLYDVQNNGEEMAWGGEVDMHTSSPFVKNQFLIDLDMPEESLETEVDISDKDLEETGLSDQAISSVKDKIYHLDESVSVWSDYLYGHLHPKSLLILEEFCHRSETEKFDLFPQGNNLLGKGDAFDELEDKLHFFIEECDNLQGFQILANFNDGFSGMAAGVVELLQDEYHGKGILTWGLMPTECSTSSTMADSYRVINSALAFDRLSQNSSYFVPVSLNSSLWRKQGPTLSSPYLNYDHNLHYHTSAIVASCIEMASLPFRQANKSITISELCNMLSSGGKKLGTLCSSFPFPLPESKSLVTRFIEMQDTFSLQPLAPHTGPFDMITPYSQFVTCSGIPSNKLTGHVPQPQSPFEMANSVDEIMKIFIAGLFPRTTSSLLTVNQAHRTSSPYPNIFTSLLLPNGLVGDKPRPEDQAVKSLPALTSLQSSPVSCHLLTKLSFEAKKLDLRRYHGFLESNMDADEYQDSLENLETLRQRYETGSLQDSSDDSD